VDDRDDVAPDGSPVDVYLALPAEPALGYVRSVLAHRSSVLDLGSGPGRLADALAADGHDVVAVDDSPLMLAHVVGAEPVLEDVWALDLDRRFDAVLASSHLLNDPEPSRRLQLLQVCRAHVRDGGTVVIQRYPPGWQPTEGRSEVGEVGVHLHDVVGHADGSFSAIVTYRLGDRRWDQAFAGWVVDDDELASLAAAAGFAVGEPIDAGRAWVVLRPSGSGP
jgi:SAM-dependent methyltransferase